MLRKPSLILALATLSGCAGIDVATYQEEKPELKLEEYFNGTLHGWGMFQKRSGEVVKRFKVIIDGRWKDNQGVLDERFTYSDGSTQQRIWRLKKENEYEYSGQADDVVGTARGRISGNALHWVYKLKLPVKKKVLEVELDDWMYLQEDGVLINRTIMKKFGFKIGEITFVFEKEQ